MILLPAVLLGNAPLVQRALVAGALFAPIPTIVVVGLLLTRARRRRVRPVLGVDGAALLGVLASLQAGATLRSGLASLSSEVDRLVAVGASTAALADAVDRALPEQGSVAAAAVRLLDRAGGPAVPVLEELAAQAAETMRIRREVRAAVAAPVLQGAIVGGAPLVVLISLVVTGGFARNLATSAAHAVTVTAGAVMTVLGVGWVVAIVRKAMP
ncbi:MAG TPA: hypothetical protein VMS74_08490 [Acidimicrobiia bacterium]|nr:hypothetical protein [Acidimicrobiia bacterium]